MFQKPFDNLAMSGNGLYYSEPVELGADNAINVTASVIGVTGSPTNLTVKYQLSNDLSNWISNAATFVIITTPVAGSQASANNLGTPLTARYVRLSAQLTAGTSPKALVYAELNTSRLT